MKFFIVLSAIIVAINAFAWSNFKDINSKTYENDYEEQLRFSIFQNNLKTMEEHNAKYKKGEVSYFKAVNKFTDWTPEEFMAMLTKQINTKPKMNSTLLVPDKNVAVAESIDWRDHGAVLAVKDQGNCESSWAFSTTGALEGQLAITKKSTTKLSEQELVDCITENAGCNGGDVGLAFEYVKKNGLSSENNYKYTGQEGTCQTGSKELKSISGYKHVDNNENALKTAVATMGPATAELTANVNWQSYGGGVLEDPLCLSDNPNHAVLVVGYGNENTDYWIVKNSWGTGWGAEGYMKLGRGKNQCGIANNPTYPEL